MLNMIVATHAEATPVISHLKLRKEPDVLNYYRCDDTHLVVSGIGKCNAATACGWLANKTYGRQPVAWFNFGIAGHLNASLGSAFLAHKITDRATQKVWFPHQFLATATSSDLVTVDNPESDYKPNQLYDMEASAFVEASRKFSDAELVQCVKVVSDNHDKPLSEVNSKVATKLITDNLEFICSCIEALKSLRKTITIPEYKILENIYDHWHFSVSQKVILERLIQRHYVLIGPLSNMPEAIRNAQTSKEVILNLQHILDNTDISL